MKPYIFASILVFGLIVIVWAQTTTPAPPPFANNSTASTPQQTERDANRPGMRTPRETTNDQAVKVTSKKKRIREDTVFKAKRCIFRVVGSRVVMFSEDETERYTCLENLNLERVMQVIRENSAEQIWTVDGRFTEYLGDNYILIERVALAPPTPSAS
ncbi:MAG: hypothetical protein ACRC2T_09080 [Thermoguttaceae bacterium]